MPAAHVSLPSLPPAVSGKEWGRSQRADLTISALWSEVLSPEKIQDVALGYFVQGDLLVRKWVPCDANVVGEAIYQVIVPTEFRDMVLKVAHDDCGHLGVRKTYDRVLHYFFWPRLKRDVAKYVKSCHICQLTGKPLCPISAVSQPLPPSKYGCAYLLTVMCQVTRYPVAFPLRSISVKSVVKAFTQFISTFGIPQIIQSDQGSNFTSHMF